MHLVAWLILYKSLSKFWVDIPLPVARVTESSVDGEFLAGAVSVRYRTVQLSGYSKFCVSALSTAVILLTINMVKA